MFCQSTVQQSWNQYESLHLQNLIFFSIAICCSHFLGFWSLFPRSCCLMKIFLLRCILSIVLQTEQQLSGRKLHRYRKKKQFEMIYVQYSLHLPMSEFIGFVLWLDWNLSSFADWCAQTSPWMRTDTTSTASGGTPVSESWHCVSLYLLASRWTSSSVFSFCLLKCGLKHFGWDEGLALN